MKTIGGGLGNIQDAKTLGEAGMSGLGKIKKREEDEAEALLEAGMASGLGRKRKGYEAGLAGLTGMKSGGKVSSASKRADGCAIKGKTKGRMI